MGENLEEGDVSVHITGFDTSLQSNDFLAHIDYAINVTYENKLSMIKSHVVMRRFRDFAEVIILFVFGQPCLFRTIFVKIL